MLWVFGVFSVSLLVATGTIGCGDDKKKKKNDPAAATATSTGTDSTVANPNGPNAAADNDKTGTNGKSPPDGSSTGSGDAADEEAPEDSEEAGATPGGASAAQADEGTSTFYTSKDFPKGTQKLSTAFANSTIAANAASVLLPYIPITSVDSPACTETLDKTTWTGNAKNIKLEVSKTVDCKAGTDFAKYDVKVNLNFEYSCKNEVFSGIVGKTVKDTRGTNLLKYCKESVATHQASANIIVSYATKADPNETIESSKKWAVSTANGSPCTIITTKTSLAIADDCQGYLTSKDLSNSGDIVTSTLIGKYRSATGTLEDRALNSGFFDFSINNWKGSIKFNSNSAAPFKATDGDTTIQDYLK